MTSQEINASILSQLREYAELYFDAIIKHHTDREGVCCLRPGNYAAKDLTDNSHKSVFGHAWMLPTDSIFDEQVTITAGAFRCQFLYRNIFAVLHAWEAATRPRKRSVFSIGSVEEVTAEVILNEATPTGSFRTKRTKLRRIHGNWWSPTKVAKSGTQLVYCLNGVYFHPGRQIFSLDQATAPATVSWCSTHDGDFMINALIRAISDSVPYWAEIARRAGIDTTADNAVDKVETTETPARADEDAERRAEPQRQRQRMEQEQAEQARREPLFADAGKMLLTHQEVPSGQLLLLADALHIRVNPRTRAFIIEKVSKVIWRGDENGTVSVWRRGRSRVNATADVVRAIASALTAKEAMAEKREAATTPEAAPQATETPQISAPPAQVEKLSTGADATAHAPTIAPPPPLAARRLRPRPRMAITPHGGLSPHHAVTAAPARPTGYRRPPLVAPAQFFHYLYTHPPKTPHNGSLHIQPRVNPRAEL